MTTVMKPRGYWTLERLADEALKYRTRKEFREESASAYVTAKAQRMLEQICGHMIELKKPPGYWTFEQVQVQALKFRTRTEFASGVPSAYRIAQYHGWLDKICAHMEYDQLPNGYWTFERVKAEASKYKTRAEFSRAGHPYQAAWKSGWLDKVCAHMEDRTPSDRDTIYVWEAVGVTYNGKRVFKIGLTSERLGDARIKQVSRKTGIEARVLTMRSISRWNVPYLERKLLTVGEDPKLEGCGREFRALSDDELQSVLTSIEIEPVL